MNPHIWPAIITLLAIVVMFWTGLRVAKARGRYAIDAPATTGNPEFERIFRVQMNTMEQALLFLPALWLAAAYGPAWLVGLLGMVWVVGRVVYVFAYSKDASKRGPAFTVAALATVVLLLVAAFGVGRAALGL